jgi:hypothetical protein
MSFNTNMATIEVDGITYDVESKSDSDGDQVLTIERDGEPVFEGLEGHLGYEREAYDVMSPREWSNVGIICCHYDRYDLGDEDIKQVDFQVGCDVCDESGYVPAHSTHAADQGDPGDEDGEVTCNKCGGNGWYEINAIDYFKRERGARVVLPVIVYEHSGITMRVGHVGDIPGDAQGWDTSFAGYTFDTPEKVKECMGDDVTDEQIEKALRDEMSSYASYLEGDVTWYSVQDDETNYMEGCGGYVGDHDYCEEECYRALEQAIIKRIAEEKERAYWLAREVVTV